MSDKLKEDLKKAKEKILERYLKKDVGKLREIMAAKRTDAATFNKMLWPQLKKKGFTRKMLQDCEEDVSLIPDDNAASNLTDVEPTLTEADALVKYDGIPPNTDGGGDKKAEKASKTEEAVESAEVQIVQREPDGLEAKISDTHDPHHDDSSGEYDFFMEAHHEDEDPEEATTGAGDHHSSDEESHHEDHLDEKEEVAVVKTDAGTEPEEMATTNEPGEAKHRTSEATDEFLNKITELEKDEATAATKDDASANQADVHDIHDDSSEYEHFLQLPHEDDEGHAPVKTDEHDEHDSSEESHHDDDDKEEPVKADEPAKMEDKTADTKISVTIETQESLREKSTERTRTIRNVVEHRLSVWQQGSMIDEFQGSMSIRQQEMLIETLVADLKDMEEEKDEEIHEMRIYMYELEDRVIAKENEIEALKRQVLEEKQKNAGFSQKQRQQQATNTEDGASTPAAAEDFPELDEKTSNADRGGLIEELKRLHKVISVLEVEKTDLQTKMEALQNSDTAQRQVGQLGEKIADLNSEIENMNTRFESEKNEMRMNHEDEIERLQMKLDEAEQKLAAARAAPTVAPQQESEVFKQNQQELAELRELISDQLTKKVEELRQKDEEIAELQDRLDNGSHDERRERSRSLFVEDWKQRVEENMQADLYEIRDMKEQVDLVSKFLQTYSNLEMWKTEKRSIGGGDVTVYNLSFENHEIAVRFSMLMPFMMYLAQGIGIDKSTYSFASLINSGDEARKAHFAETCKDVYDHLHKRAETPPFGFVYSFLTSLFSSFDGIEQLVGRRIPLDTIPQGTLPTDWSEQET